MNLQVVRANREGVTERGTENAPTADDLASAGSRGVIPLSIEADQPNAAAKAGPVQTSRLPPT